MAIVTQAKFAKEADVNRSSINRAISAGSLVVRPDGKLDTDNPVNQDYIRRCNDKKSQKRPTPKEITKDDIEQTGEIDNDLDFSIDSIEDSALENLSRTSLEKIKIAENIKQTRVKTQKERLKLVDRETVQKVFSKLYMVDVNMWRTLGANLSPEIASIAKIDDNEIIIKVGEVIEKEVFVILGHVKRTMNEFLLEIEAEEIE
jgi:membrane-associated HD superfamily phosphohydrolase